MMDGDVVKGRRSEFGVGGLDPGVVVEGLGGHAE
jgi:hypothetical protein